MIQNYHKQVYKNQGLPTKINDNESKLARMLAIDSSEDDVISNHGKKVVLKPARTFWKLQNTQKLEAMMTKLKKDITVVINYGERRNEVISEHRIFIRLDLLNTYIEQVIYIKDVIKRGGTIFLETLFAMQKKTNDTLNKIREDVFNAYLELETENKYNIARQGGQLTCIFTLLGVIERELHSTYEKISQAISKRNEHRHKNNKAVSELFASFRSLPALKSSKHKSKERLTFIRKNGKEKNFNSDNSEPDNIPPEKPKVSENIEAYDHSLNHQNTDLANHKDFLDPASKNSMASCFHNLEENNYSLIQKSSDNELYEDCKGPAEIKQYNKEFRATEFEINISDENIQIKIPTNVIYLVRNSNLKSNMKIESEHAEHSLNREIDQSSVSGPQASPYSSVTDFHTESSMSEESLSSVYTDIITDSELGTELEKDSNLKNNSEINCKERNNNEKCIPFFSKNGYCYPVTKKDDSTKSIHSSEIKIDKEEIEKHSQKNPVFSLLKDNTNLTSEYEDKNWNLGNPLFGNILQLVDLIKKIYCNCNDQTKFENLEILPNIDESNSLTNAILQHCNDCPPSISQSSLECPSLWKESASRLCDLCPSCVNIAKLSNDV